MKQEGLPNFFSDFQVITLHSGFPGGHCRNRFLWELVTRSMHFYTRTHILKDRFEWIWINPNRSSITSAIGVFSFRGSQVAGGGEREQSIFNLNPPPSNAPDLKTGSSQPKRSKISPKQWFSTISILKQADVPLPPWFNPLCIGG